MIQYLVPATTNLLSHPQLNPRQHQLPLPSQYYPNSSLERNSTANCHHSFDTCSAALINSLSSHFMEEVQYKSIACRLLTGHLLTLLFSQLTPGLLTTHPSRRTTRTPESMSYMRYIRQAKTRASSSWTTTLGYKSQWFDIYMHGA